MPYRRLPNTDAARHKALTRAFEIGKELPPFKLAFSQSTFQRVQSFLPMFEKAMYETKRILRSSDGCSLAEMQKELDFWKGDIDLLEADKEDYFSLIRIITRRTKTSEFIR